MGKTHGILAPASTGVHPPAGSHLSPATARRTLPSSCAPCEATPPRSPGQTPEIDDAFLGRRTQTREHHGLIKRKDDGTAWLLDDEAPRKGKPAQPPVEGHQMLLTDEQRKRDVMIVRQGRGGTAQGCAGVALALGLRVGFHAPH